MPQNPKHFVLERRHKVSDLYLKGWYQSQIAAELGFTQQQISKDLKAIHEQWIKENVHNIDILKQRELSKIDNMEREYWLAWEKSKEDYQQKIIKAKGTGAKDPEGKQKVNAVENTTKNMIVYGDPRFLQGIQWCIERRCLIMGIDAPKKQDITIMKVGKDLADENYI